MHPFRLLILVSALLLTTAAKAQNVGIGTATPDASAVLDLTSTGKGMLVPRLTAAQRAAIGRPAAALLVYQTDGAQPGFWYNAGTATSPGWTFFNPTADNLGNHTATQTLNLQGNALTGTGADIGAVVGVGVRADGGLNIGQNTNSNVFLGYLSGSANTTGSQNQFVGYQSGYANTSGNQNQFSGTMSGYSNTTGFNNLFSGYQSGYSNTTGSANQFNGYLSGAINTSGSENQFSGYYSGFSNTTGNQNQFSGPKSGYSNTSGIHNLFSGYGSGYSNTTGNRNQFNGYQSGYSNTSGSENQFSGYLSGANNTTGSSNWAFGYQAGPTTGNLTNAGAIGYNAQVSQSNSLVLGGTSPFAVKVGIGTTAPRGTLDVAGGGDTYLVANPNNGNGQSVYLPGHLYLAPYGTGTPVAYIQATSPTPRPPPTWV